MSMTQIAFVRKAEIPTNKEIQESVERLNYDFKILNDPEKQIDNDGLECVINGHKTFLKIHIDSAADIVAEANWIKPDLSDQDTAISFVWGADFAAGACIGLISIALIDYCNAPVYYMDDEMKYSKEMLLSDAPQFINELNKLKQ